MQQVKYDPEILYVQKLYFFLFLATFSLLAAILIGWRVGVQGGIFSFLIGLIISYAAMLRKKTFSPPQKKVTVQRMAREISQDTSPLAISRFASQLYYYLHEPGQAISLLEKFLSSHDPLLCATLADILYKEGRTKQALSVARDNPYALIDPLLLATQGHILKELGKLQDAARMYERSLRLAKEAGFPHNGAHWLTQHFLSLAYTGSIHHALADCYLALKDFDAAKQHYRAGNRRFLDLTFWRFPSQSITRPAKNYTKFH
ncbi:tetratricopeptide repeat protein [Paradesulfitobacterium ferrireducens]|uniref:tetratricopeptide repeat protein n=1 Tax=Paradesulfitobacterium ferrireducens TaxID=2816476 RepID=UPI001A8CC873|nr:tetratricopeptide repeat protein [Paradesulfitobacterium ferrireducens]